MNIADIMSSKGLSMGGTILGAAGQFAAGSAAASAGASQQAADEFQAAQLRQNANTAEGVGQLQAIEAKRQTDLLNSRALAVAAASGAGASDPTVINLIAKNASEGAYRQQVALYGGEDKARLMGLQADALDYQGSVAASHGRQEQVAHELAAGAGILRGNTMLSRYGGNGPNLMED